MPKGGLTVRQGRCRIYLLNRDERQRFRSKDLLLSVNKRLVPIIAERTVCFGNLNSVFGLFEVRSRHHKLLAPGI